MFPQQPSEATLPFQPFYNPYPAYGQMQQGQMPYGQQMQGVPSIQHVQEQPVHGFAFVHGIEGARAYYLPNGSEMPLFDDELDILYEKTVDQSGRMTIKVKDCIDHVDQPERGIDYATQDDIRALQDEIDKLRTALNERPSRTTRAAKEQ